MTYGQMIAAIQCYIHHVKNVEVMINLPRNIGEIKKMQQMYLIASAYLNSWYVKVLLKNRLIVLNVNKCYIFDPTNK